jgi:hypothetical protein
MFLLTFSLLTQRDYPLKNPYATKPGEKPYVMEIVWRNVFAMLYAHFAALMFFWTPVKLPTFLIGILCKFKREFFAKFKYFFITQLSFG